MKKPWLEGRERQGGTSTTARAPDHGLGMARSHSPGTTTAPGPAPAQGCPGALAAQPMAGNPSNLGSGSSARPKHLQGPEKTRWNQRLKRVKSLSPNKDTKIPLLGGEEMPAFPSIKAKNQHPAGVEGQQFPPHHCHSRSPEAPLEPAWGESSIPRHSRCSIPTLESKTWHLQDTGAGLVLQSNQQSREQTFTWTAKHPARGTT